MMNVQCDKCGKWITHDTAFFSTIEKDGLKVLHFSCPFCGEKYHVHTENAEMHELIGRRTAVQTMIRVAREKKLRRQTIRKYQRELQKIIQKQKKLMPELKRLGEAILKESKTEG